MNDARYYQILVLFSLFVYGTFQGLFDIEVWHAPLILTTCIVTQFMCCRIFKLKIDFKSAIITALSLTLLLRVNSPEALILGGVIAISSKFFIRDDKGHVFNPANLALIICSISGLGWISPGQWGSDIFLALFFSLAALMVLSKSKTSDIAFSFLLFYGAILITRALWLGDPMEIPLHNLKSGALLLFSFFMISDPKTIPESFGGRILFAFGTAFIASVLQLAFYIPLAIIYALGICSILCRILFLLRVSFKKHMRFQ